MAAVAAASALTACNGLWPGRKPDKEKDDEVSPMPVLVACKNRSISMFVLDPIRSSVVEVSEILAHAMSGLARWRIDNGVVTVTPELAKELVTPEENADGSVTYTYSLVDGATWSDGEEVTADDFVFAWNRAANVANGAPFRDLFNCIQGYSDAPDAQLAVEATDKKTLKVTLTHSLPYWNELLAFTPFLPLRRDFLEGKAPDDYAWMTDVEAFLYNGPYSIAEFNRATYESPVESLVFKKRPGYMFSDNITVDEIRFVYGKDKKEELALIEASDSSDTILSDSKLTSIHVIDTVGSDLLSQAQGVDGISRRAVPLLGTDWLVWNVNKRLLPDSNGLVGDGYEMAQAEVRRAFSLLIDRNGLVKRYYGYKAASSLVPPGISDAGGADFQSNAGSSTEYTGYWDVSDGSTERNTELAIGLLRKHYQYDEASGKFLDAPPIQLLGFGKNIGPLAENLMQSCAQIGIAVSYELLDYESMMERQRNGAFDLSIGNWYADFTDPIAFLSLYATTNAQNTCQLGRGQHEQARIYSVDLSSVGEEATISSATWHETYDMLLERSAIEKDIHKRFALLHKAEDLLMETWAVMPVWHPATAYIVKEGITGLEALPFNWIFYGHAGQETPK